MISASCPRGRATRLLSARLPTRDRAVDAFLDQVDAAIAGAQGQLQAGVLRQPSGQGGDDQAPGDAAGHIDVQAPADVYLAVVEQLVEFGGVCQQAPRPFQQNGAVGGQLHMAGGAVQQSGAEAGFQLLHGGRDGGPWQFQGMGSLMKLPMSATWMNTRYCSSLSIV